MREIKFRMWNCVAVNPIKSKMFYDTINVITCLHQQIDFNAGNEKLGYNHLAGGSAFMQFTGLKDCKGKDIYEGDLLHRHMGVYWTVVFEGGKWVAKPKTESGLYLDYSQFTESEIIGNIYENPELLNQ